MQHIHVAQKSKPTLLSSRLYSLWRPLVLFIVQPVLSLGVLLNWTSHVSKLSEFKSTAFWHFSGANRNLSSNKLYRPSSLCLLLLTHCLNRCQGFISLEQRVFFPGTKLPCEEMDAVNRYAYPAGGFIFRGEGWTSSVQNRCFDMVLLLQNLSGCKAWPLLYFLLGAPLASAQMSTQGNYLLFLYLSVLLPDNEIIGVSTPILDWMFTSNQFQLNRLWRRLVYFTRPQK